MRKYLIIASFFILSLGVFLIVYGKKRQDTVEAFHISAITEDEIKNELIYVKFGVTPMVGAHNPLGYDVLLYSVDYAGKGKLIQYEHIENYDVPEKFQDYIISPFP